MDRYLAVPAASPVTLEHFPFHACQRVGTVTLGFRQRQDRLGVELTSANLTGADLKGADLRGANLKDAILKDALYPEYLQARLPDETLPFS